MVMVMVMVRVRLRAIKVRLECIPASRAIWWLGLGFELGSALCQGLGVGLLLH